MSLKSVFRPFVFILFIFAFTPRQPASAAWQGKIAPVLLEAAEKEPVEFLVILSAQADLAEAAMQPTKAARGRYVFETLSALSAASQAPLLAELEKAGVEHRSYWVTNFIWVRGGPDLIAALAARPDVAFIDANRSFAMDPAIREASLTDAPAAIEWNLARVNADDLWGLGIDGSGAVIAGQDTGYEWDHPALVNQYRGWNGAAADHNYSWHDAVHSANAYCPADSPEPCDDFGHGTHTMGIMVGDDGGTNRIGMAPGARWIGCRNMDQGVGTFTTYSECFQWFIAPTDLNGENPEPALAPDVVNNSWACPPSEEGCTNPFVLQAVVQNVRAAGILVVASAGNSGSACRSVNNPPGMYEPVFSVGNTNSLDGINPSSSRGPAWNGSAYILKPNVTAPGTAVRSAYLNGQYASLTGTSMSAPHVAGLAGLLIDADPGLAGRVGFQEWLISRSAVPLTSAQDCAPFPGNVVPNAVYGYGRIDALAAYDLLQRPDLYFPLVFAP